MSVAFDQLFADTDQPHLSHSRSPDKPTSQNARDKVNTTHHPMSIANLASPNPIRVEGQPSIPSLPTPTASPKPPTSTRDTEGGPSQTRPSQISEDVAMEDDTDGVEDEDVGDTTERIGDEDMEDDEAGGADEEGVDEDEEDSEEEDDDEESEDDEDDDDDVRDARSWCESASFVG